ncbi:Pyridoxamine 5'-phosphate oxidase family protein [Arabidopsis thaliana]|jgi:hypothetical protein|uniref:Pyridoxamine 5'-phosphate oxidase family protein n=1 Tax=Arabidopsis thaliana TaxID=3702 RepID=A0A1P8AZ49_ARATH|nr:Pyridoxamine 5'-phosphate oxidase family protein [Arabidopsis thaliana]ANM61928.1 Pyridoxamine 5'-phosphate oxidase family protein [Arabidopsis thaliana]|eukprot:NP_001324117.1 Pyridoxamine 5'-phosphate oxidase family protein [Arabidopsis thaliana]
MELQVLVLRPIFFFFFFVFLTILQQSSSARVLTITKPDRHDYAASARWLVSQNSWGVLSTLSVDHKGAPFGNVVSFSDGLPEKGNGIPYFYLTTLDPTARNALKDQRASLAISESPLGTCTRDPMNPTCSKLTLTGKVKEFFLIDTTKKLTVKCFGLYLIIMFQLLILEGGSEEAEVAKKALFTKHPEMMDWPKDHDFRFFKLEIIDIFLINWYGGAKPITVDEYLHAKS